MKTQKMRTLGVIFSAGILLTSCVSSKKYHASQAAVAKLQSDSAALAQQVSTLHQNVSTMEQKNNDLQKSVEAAGTTNTGLQKNVAYYTDYAGKQQASITAINNELKTTLTPAGLTDQDIMTTDGKIYVNIGEKSLFKGNSAVLTTKGKELVDNLGQFVKSHEAVDVSVADLQMATSGEGGATTTTTMDASGSTTSTTTSDMNPSASADKSSKSSSAANRSYTKTKGKTMDANATTSADNTTVKTRSKKKDIDANAAIPADNTTVKHSVAVHHAKKAPAATDESKAVTYSSGNHNKYATGKSNRSMARAMAWKRQTVVADALLKNGIPKIKLVSQLPNGELSSTQKGVQIVLVNDMDNFYKHMSEAPGTQPMGKNP